VAPLSRRKSALTLDDDLAACRQLYSRSLPTLPDILVIDIPSRYAGANLPLGRYYPVILETAAEHAEMESFLVASRPEPVVPDLFDRRPSALHSDDILFARYAPPAAGWPWVLLCRWPTVYTAMVPADGDMFARGAYTVELFGVPADLERSEARLLATLGPHTAIRVDPFPGPVGHA
jgi:hypothetical protein